MLTTNSQFIAFRIKVKSSRKDQFIDTQELLFKVFTENDQLKVFMWDTSKGRLFTNECTNSIVQIESFRNDNQIVMAPVVDLVVDPSCDFNLKLESIIEKTQINKDLIDPSILNQEKQKEQKITQIKQLEKTIVEKTLKNLTDNFKTTGELMLANSDLPEEFIPEVLPSEDTDLRFAVNHINEKLDLLIENISELKIIGNDTNAIVKTVLTPPKDTNTIVKAVLTPPIEAQRQKQISQRDTQLQSKTKQQRELRDPVTPYNIVSIVNAVSGKNDYYKSRDRTALLFMFITGLTVQALPQISVHDFRRFLVAHKKLTLNLVINNQNKILTFEYYKQTYKPYIKPYEQGIKYFLDQAVFNFEQRENQAKNQKPQEDKNKEKREEKEAKIFPFNIDKKTYTNRLNDFLKTTGKTLNLELRTYSFRLGVVTRICSVDSLAKAFQFVHHSKSSGMLSDAEKRDLEIKAFIAYTEGRGLTVAPAEILREFDEAEDDNYK